MKALVIPDVHLKPYMFTEAAERMRKGVADRVVCLMDIPDDWNREYDLELYAQTFHISVYNAFVMFLSFFSNGSLRE